MSAVVVRITGEFDDAAFKKLQTTLNRLGVDIEDVEKKAAPAFEALGKSMVATGDKMAAFGKSWSRNISLPLAGLAAVSLKVAGDFEQTMNVLQVNADASAAQIEKLKDMAIQFGQDTVFSAGEAADAMLELTKGGLTVADIQGGALASTLALAATEGMGLADASTIVVQAMNSFGLSAKDTGKVVDTLAAGAVASTAGVQDLAAGLKYVGTTAHQFGISVTDSVTALAAMNNAGLDSTTAGTSLNRFFLGLIGGTKKSRDAIKGLGLEFFNAQGQMKPMKEIIAELDTAMKNMTDQDRAQAMKTIFGVEGMRAGNILLAEGVQGWTDLSKAVDKNGIAQDMADARMKGFNGAMEQLKGSLETAAIKIGDVLAPTIQSLAGFVQGLVNVFVSMPEPMQRIIVVIGALVAAIGPVVFIIGKVTSGIGSMLLAFGKLPMMFSTVASAASSLFTFLLANPFVAIAAAVVIMAIIIIKNWDTIKEMLTATWQFITDTASTVWNALVDFFKKWGEYIFIAITGPIGLMVIAIVKNWDTIKETTMTVFNAIKDAILGAINLIKSGVTNGLDFIRDGFVDTFNGIKSVVSGIMSSVTGTVKGAVNSIIDLVNVMIRGLNTIHFEIPSWVPGLGGKSFGINIPQIPKLADGGIVNSPTLALIGEAGPEAVVPLRSSAGQNRLGSGVTIASGAVQININGPVDQGSLGSIERIVDEALARLAREVSYA